MNNRILDLKITFRKVHVGRLVRMTVEYWCSVQLAKHPFTTFARVNAQISTLAEGAKMKVSAVGAGVAQALNMPKTKA